MSSTNRGAKRVKNDFYETPSWCVEAIAPHLPKYLTVLDPCAGQGAILRAFERHAFRLTCTCSASARRSTGRGQTRATTGFSFVL